MLWLILIMICQTMLETWPSGLSNEKTSRFLSEAIVPCFNGARQALIKTHNIIYGSKWHIWYTIWPEWHSGPILYYVSWAKTFRDSKFHGANMGPTWGPPGSRRPQMGPMLAPWTLLSGLPSGSRCCYNTQRGQDICSCQDRGESYNGREPRHHR